jgi:hypothetical protein
LNAFRTLALVALAMAVVSRALAAPPSLESVSPGVGQRGSSFSLKLIGARFGQAADLLLHRPGITVEKLTIISDNECLATLKAGPDCPLGTHPIRVRSAGGVSEVQLVRITPFPVVSWNRVASEGSDEPLVRPAPAAWREGVTLAGSIEPETTESVRIRLEKGERIGVEVEAIRFGAEMFDAELTLVGPDGATVAKADDTSLLGPEPFLEHEAAASGEYRLEWRDSAGDGGPNHRYALHLGLFPRPVTVFPPGGRAGETLNVMLLGGVASELMNVVLPKTPGRFDWYPERSGRRAPTPIPLHVTSFPNFVEGALPAVPPELPVAVSGVLGKPAEVDRCSFRARAGTTWRLELFAHRIGSPIDTVLKLFDAEGNQLGRNDDDATRDSRLTVTFPADGVYTATIEDKRGGGGPLAVWRLEIAPPTPEVTLFPTAPARKSQEGRTVQVPRGGRAIVMLGVRRDGIDGPAVIRVDDLPPGVSVASATAAPDRHLVPVEFVAGADAPIQSGLVRATATVGTLVGGFRQVIDLVRGPGDSAFCSETVDRLAVSVVEPHPIRLTLVAPTGSLSPDGGVELELRVERRPGTDGPLALRFPSLPPGVEPPENPVILKSEDTTLRFSLRCRPEGDLGSFPVFVEAVPAPRAGRTAPGPGQPGMTMMTGAGGDAPRRGRRRPGQPPEELAPACSNLIELRVIPCPIAAKLDDVSAEAGGTVPVRCRWTGKLPGPSSARWVARLAGMPPRMTSEPVTIAAGVNEVSLLAKLDPTTPAGVHEDLHVELTGPGMTLRLGRDGRMIVHPAGSLRLGPDGKPLSDLEKLRQDASKSSRSRTATGVRP